MRYRPYPAYKDSGAPWLGQVPEMIEGPWGARRREAAGDWPALRSAGPGMAIFEAMVAAAAQGGKEASHAS